MSENQNIEDSKSELDEQPKLDQSNDEVGEVAEQTEEQVSDDEVGEVAEQTEDQVSDDEVSEVAEKIAPKKAEIVNENIQWYVVRAISGQEKKIKHYLETEITRAKLNDWIPEILIAIEKVYEMRNGKKKVREKNFFPGYIMVKADLTYGEVFHTITSIPGVIGFLEGTQSSVETDSKGKKKYIKLPMPMRQSEINRILGRVDDEADVVDKLDANFVMGERVKVIGELFNGFDGVIEEIFEERKKLKVMVKVFGRDTPVELNYAQVEKQE